MAQRDRKTIDRALKKKGFEKTSGDHSFYTLEVDGKRTPIFTKLSRGSGYKVYGDSLLGLMARQLKVSKGDLLDLIDCPLSGEMYVEKLRDARLL